jgi:drug/metabolite transporter (DMT)-like permease
MRPILLLLVLVVLLFVSGQLFGKAGALRLDRGGLDLITAVLVLSAYGCLVMRGVLWILVLKRLPLSVAYPCLSVVYVIVLFASVPAFGETLTPAKVVGTLLVLGGVAIVGLSGMRKEGPA